MNVIIDAYQMIDSVIRSLDCWFFTNLGIFINDLGLFYHSFAKERVSDLNEKMTLIIILFSRDLPFIEVTAILLP
jgi:hypothetical protein